MKDWSQIMAKVSLPTYMEFVDTANYGDQLYEIFRKALVHAELVRPVLLKSVWCDGVTLTEGATDELAIAMLRTQKNEFWQQDIAGDTNEYLRGHCGYDNNDNLIWISWGIGSPIDGGCDEILLVSYPWE